jgi:fucose permease
MLARVVSSRLLLRVSGPALVLAGVLGTAVGIAVLLAAHDGQMAALGVVLIGLSAASIYPTVLGQAGSRFEEHSGTVFGILFSIALAGGMTLPWLVGHLAQAYGLRRALLVSLAATLLVGGFQALIARKTGAAS